MRQRINPDVDIVMQVLEATIALRPADAFLQSLLQQYRERGGLSKKQLQGLHAKASKTGQVPPQKLATLEAIIMRKVTRNRSELPLNEPLYKKNEATGEMLQAILKLYPGHKRVQFLDAKYRNNEPLSAPESAELQKFYKLLVKI